MLMTCCWHPQNACQQCITSSSMDDKSFLYYRVLLSWKRMVDAHSAHPQLHKEMWGSGIMRFGKPLPPIFFWIGDRTRTSRHSPVYFFYLVHLLSPSFPPLSSCHLPQSFISSLHFTISLFTIRSTPLNFSILNHRNYLHTIFSLKLWISVTIFFHWNASVCYEIII